MSPSGNEGIHEGVTGIFCGAVLGVILLRRAYNSVDKIISSPEGPARK
jgi:hypothetical protein